MLMVSRHYSLEIITRTRMSRETIVAGWLSGNKARLCCPASFLPCGFGALFAKGRARLFWQMSNRFFSARDSGCFLDVPSRRGLLFFGCHNACKPRTADSAFFAFPRRLAFPLGLRHFAQFSFAHRFVHAFGRAFERRLLAFTSLGGQRCACGHLLFF